MKKQLLWSEADDKLRGEFYNFSERIAHFASGADRSETFSDELLDDIKAERLLSALIPQEYGGMGLNPLAFGFLNEAFGHACTSSRNLLTVHSMVCQAVNKWGTQAQKAKWLPMLCADAVGAFALTEPKAGSDAASIESRAEKTEGGWKLSGTKKWITFGQKADVFLVFAKAEGDKIIAMLVEAKSPGIGISPLGGMLGARASMLAEINFSGCFVPDENVLSRPGFGFAVCASALETGRLSVAWGSTGLCQACLDLSADHALKRAQFGKPIIEHQQVAALIADMMTNTRASRLLCLQASASCGKPGASADVLTAKYFASRSAMKSAGDTVQILGAAGLHGDSPAGRFFRDAKSLEIIEGTSQIIRNLLAQTARMDLSGH